MDKQTALNCQSGNHHQPLYLVLVSDAEAAIGSELQVVRFLIPIPMVVFRNRRTLASKARSCLDPKPLPTSSSLHYLLRRHRREQLRRNDAVRLALPELSYVHITINSAFSFFSSSMKSLPPPAIFAFTS